MVVKKKVRPKRYVLISCDATLEDMDGMMVHSTQTVDKHEMI